MPVLHSHRKVGVSVDKENRETNDFYPTPALGILALIGAERFHGTIWEPAAGDGAISQMLEDFGYTVISTDLIDRGYCEHGVNFFTETQPRAPNIVTNPPYKYATEFVQHSLSLTTGKVAMLLRLSFLEGNKRAKLFKHHPPARVWVFSRRLKFHRPGWIDSGAGGMVAYAWFVWDHGYKGKPEIGWV